MDNLKYDVFISYRRDGGSERAELIKLMLEKNGFDESRIFMDTHSIYSCNFKQRLKEAVFQSKNFVLIITKGCFDFIKDNDYWLFEIEEAISLGKKIVPVFFDGINSIDPSILPGSIKQLHEINGVFYHHQYADAFYLKLMTFLDDKNAYASIEKGKNEMLYRNKYMLIFVSSAFILLSIIYLYIHSASKGSSSPINHSLDSVKHYQPSTIAINNIGIIADTDLPNNRSGCNIYQTDYGWTVEDTKINEQLAYKESFNNTDFYKLVRLVISRRSSIKAPVEWEINEELELTKVEYKANTRQWYLYFGTDNAKNFIQDEIFRIGIQAYIEMFERDKYEHYKL